MTKTQQVKNIIAFLSILFGESKLWHEEIMNFTPEYLIEKFDFYIQNIRHSSDWGMHMSLRRCVFEPYCRKHGIPEEHYIEIGEEK